MCKTLKFLNLFSKKKFGKNTRGADSEQILRKKTNQQTCRSPRFRDDNDAGHYSLERGDMHFEQPRIMTCFFLSVLLKRRATSSSSRESGFPHTGHLLEIPGMTRG